MTRSKKYRESGGWAKPCKGCGKEMEFYYYCHAKSKKFCSSECYFKYQSSATIKNQFGIHMPWTEEEDAVLRLEYPSSPQPKLIGEKLGRPIVSVRKRAREIGVERTPEAISLGLAIGGKTNKGRARPDLSKRNVNKPLKGKDNPFYGKTHSEETRKIISEKAKEAETFKKLAKDPEFQRKRLEGYYKKMNDPEYRIKLMKALHNHDSPNKTEIRLDGIIQQLFPDRYKFVGDGSVIIDGLNPDWINMSGQKKIIELFGEHVHDPKVAVFPVSSRSTYWGRKKAFAKFGYDTLIIWCKQLKDMNKVITRIKNFHEDSYN